MPPSAMTGILAARAASAQSMIAVSCGTPTPATIRVVQIEPGPMPTLIASAPASISAFVAVGGRHIARDQRDLVRDALHPRDLIEHGLRMAVRGVDDDAIDAGVDQHFGALESLSPDVEAAATRSLPSASLEAWDAASPFPCPLTVTRPTQRKSSSTTMSFSSRC